MKKGVVLMFLMSCVFSYAQQIIGKWETYDDKTDEKKALIEIFKKGELYFAEIKDIYRKDKNKVCEKCKRELKGKPIIGLEIIQNIKKDGDEFNGGTILDPESGSVYKCYMELVEKDKLKVRGFLGFSLLGRTQYWRRYKNE